MTLRDFGLLTDENVHPGVVAYLRREGVNVLDVREEGLQGATDVLLIRFARERNRIVLTHDSDLGRLAIAGGEPFVGIVYIRPGHFSPAFTEGTLRALLSQNEPVEPPFIVVAERRRSKVRVRIRRL